MMTFENGLPCMTCKYSTVKYQESPCVDCGIMKHGAEILYVEDESEKPEASNNVDHPAHYNREGAMECIDEMCLVFGIRETMIFCKLNVWKYRDRAMDKGGIEDMRKSDWYMYEYKRLKEKLEGFNG